MNKQQLELQKRLIEIKLQRLNNFDTVKQIHMTAESENNEQITEQHNVYHIKRITNINNLMYSDTNNCSKKNNGHCIHFMNDTYYMITDVIVEVIIPDNWKYPYNIKKLGHTNNSIFDTIQIKFSSIPTEHIRTVNGYVYFELYVSYKSPKVITIKCPNKHGIVYGNVVVSVNNIC